MQGIGKTGGMGKNEPKGRKTKRALANGNKLHHEAHIPFHKIKHAKIDLKR